MGQIIPFPTAPQAFDDAELLEIWEAYAAASRCEAAIRRSSHATDLERQIAGRTVDAAYSLFSGAYQRTYGQEAS